jgi:hypothetical protein
MIRTTAALLTIAIGAIGCGASATGELPPAVFPAQALVTQSTAGGMTVAVWSSPQPPAKGLAAFQLSFVDGAGAPVDGLTVDVLPWMPAHGHGGSTRPTATATAPGVFLVQPVSFFMSGAWELRTTIGGERDDEVTVDVEVH